MTDIARPLVFDPSSLDFFDDPFPIYQRLRDEAPVYHNDRQGFYALSRYHDVYDASTNWQAFSSEHGSSLADMLNPDFRPRHILHIDPPRHDRLRALVNRAFSPRGVARLEHIVRDVILRHLAPLEGRPSFDIVEEFSALFPNEIISEVLGVAPEDRAGIRRWTDDVLFREEGESGRAASAAEAYVASNEYFLDLVRHKRRHPTDDMISDLIDAEMDDGSGEATRLTDEEVAAFAWVLGAAGTETVTKLVGNAAVLLHRHPDQRQMIVADPGLVPATVDEVLRYWAPSHLQGRFTTSDIELHGVTIPGGSPVFLITGSANRDPRAYPEPDRFDIARTDLPVPARVRPWTSLLRRRRACSHGEPDRGRGDPQALAHLRCRRIRTTPRPHGQRRRLQQRARTRVSGALSTLAPRAGVSRHPAGNAVRGMAVRVGHRHSQLRRRPTRNGSRPDHRSPPRATRRRRHGAVRC